MCVTNLCCDNWFTLFYLVCMPCLYIACIQFWTVVKINISLIIVSRCVLENMPLEIILRGKIRTISMPLDCGRLSQYRIIEEWLLV